ncbi:hypothetical protein ACG83_23635 [Frankia sp. R43]|nr:hypothetical protein ACG83_23635 [Frankia sp. R43]
MSEYVSAARMKITSTWPTASRRRGRDARDSGTYSWARVRAIRPIGMLIQKIERQPTHSTRTPPSTGPSAMLIPTTAPQTPMARARSRGSVNVFVMIDIATGLSIEPPTACTIRNATSQCRLGAMLHSREPRVNSARPA